MHLTYDLDEKDLQRGNRQKVISNALSVFSVEDREPDFGVTSVNYDLSELLQRAEPPR